MGTKEPNEEEVLAIQDVLKIFIDSHVGSLSLSLSYGNCIIIEIDLYSIRELNLSMGKGVSPMQKRGHIVRP